MQRSSQSSCVTLLLLCFLSFTPAAVASAFAQGPAPSSRELVRGEVRDTSGAAIPRPTVVVQQLPAGLEQVLTGGADGTFVLPALARGRYTVTVSAPGFAPASDVIEAPTTTPVVFELGPAPVLEQVTVVSASRQQELRDTLNTRVDVVTRSRIDESGGHETVGELLREIPGVVTRRGSETAGAAGEQIQGIDSRQVLVLLDGQPIVGARGIKRGGVLNLDRQSSARLERVEVVKGAASTLYGSEAIGGVINLITRAPSAPFESTVSIAGGSFGSLGIRLDTGFARGATSGLLTAERHQHDGFDLTPSTFDTTGAPFRRYDGLAKLRHQFGGLFSVSAFATGYRNTTGGRSIGELGPQEDDIVDHAVSGGVAAQWVAAPGTAIETRGYVSDFREDAGGHLAPPRSGPLPPASLEQHFRRFDVSVAQTIGARQLLQGGLEWARDHYDGTNRVRDEDTGHDADTAVAWLQHRWSATRRLTTTIGARVDRRSAFETTVSPKAAASFRMRDDLSVRASYGRGFRAPDLGQLYYRFLSPSNFYQVIGNPALRPEYAHSWQAGGDYTPAGRRVRLGVNVFRNDVRDLIESVNLGFIANPQQLAALLAREGIDPSFRPALGRPLFTYRNVADATTQGLELDGEFAAAPELVLGGAYTWLSARDVRSRHALTGRHRHHGYARVSWQPAHSGFRASLRGTFFGSWIAARSGGAEGGVETIAPRFALWDLAVTQRVGRRLTLLLNVDNLADSQDPNTGIVLPSGAPAPIHRPEAGRTARIGLQWSFIAR